MTKQPLAIIMTGETLPWFISLVPNTSHGFLGLSLRQNINIFLFQHFLFIITVLHHSQRGMTLSVEIDAVNVSLICVSICIITIVLTFTSIVYTPSEHLNVSHLICGTFSN